MALRKRPPAYNNMQRQTALDLKIRKKKLVIPEQLKFTSLNANDVRDKDLREKTYFVLQQMRRGKSTKSQEWIFRTVTNCAKKIETVDDAQMYLQLVMQLVLPVWTSALGDKQYASSYQFAETIYRCWVPSSKIYSEHMMEALSATLGVKKNISTISIVLHTVIGAELRYSVAGALAVCNLATFPKQISKTSPKLFSQRGSALRASCANVKSILLNKLRDCRDIISEDITSLHDFLTTSVALFIRRVVLCGILENRSKQIITRLLCSEEVDASSKFYIYLYCLLIKVTTDKDLIDLDFNLWSKYFEFNRPNLNSCMSLVQLTLALLKLPIMTNKLLPACKVGCILIGTNMTSESECKVTNDDINSFSKWNPKMLIDQSSWLSLKNKLESNNSRSLNDILAAVKNNDQTNAKVKLFSRFMSPSEAQLKMQSILSDPILEIYSGELEIDGKLLSNDKLTEDEYEAMLKLEESEDREFFESTIENNSVINNEDIDISLSDLNSFNDKNDGILNDKNDGILSDKNDGILNDKNDGILNIKKLENTYELYQNKNDSNKDIYVSSIELETVKREILNEQVYSNSEENSNSKFNVYNNDKLDQNQNPEYYNRCIDFHDTIEEVDITMQQNHDDIVLADLCLFSDNEIDYFLDKFIGIEENTDINFADNSNGPEHLNLFSNNISKQSADKSPKNLDDRHNNELYKFHFAGESIIEKENQILHVSSAQFKKMTWMIGICCASLLMTRINHTNKIDINPSLEYIIPAILSEAIYK